MKKYIKEHGWTQILEIGEKIIRPEVRLRNDTRKELRSLSVQFDFFPSSRTSVEKVADKTQFNQWEINPFKWYNINIITKRKNYEQHVRGIVLNTTENRRLGKENRQA